MNRLKAFIGFMRRETAEKYMAAALILIVFSVLCELFVFNYKWVSTIFSDPVEITSMRVSGATADDGEITFGSGSATIQIDNIDEKLRYLSLPLREADDTAVLDVTISAYDEANSASPVTAPQRTVTTAAETSQYIPLHFSGNVSSLTIKVSRTAGSSAVCEGIELNGSVPLLVSVPRIILLAAVLFAVYILRPRSFVYSIKTDLSKSTHQTAAIIAATVMALAFLGSVRMNTAILQSPKSAVNHQQYYSLVDALKDGHFYLNEEPSEELKEMENPYDLGARNANNVKSNWDHAYYDGKYYVYFGAAPVVLLYLPYNLITGADLPNYVAASVFALFFIAGVMYLLWEIIKKWFPKTPMPVYLMTSAAFVAPVLTFILYKPDLYAVPIISALTFSVFGLAFWLAAERDKAVGKKRSVQSLSPYYLCAGSICIAMTAGCRPQFLISAVFGVVLFWKYVFGSRELFSKKGWKATAAVCIPFIVIGALVMIYNAARFGSPFDFGANYNLTTNDMTKRGFVWGRTGLGIFTYLFQTMHIDALFPFIHDFDKATAYQGLTLSEKLLGGVLWLYPFLGFGLYGLVKKKLFKDSRVFVMLCAAMAAALVVVVADTQMAGLLTRYYLDFVWLMMIASSLTVFALSSAAVEGTESHSALMRVITALVLLTLAFAVLSIFARTEDSIRAADPAVYYKLQYMIAFWL